MRTETNRHQHRVRISVDRGWTHCVTPEACAENPRKQAAHGNITRIDTCACGATRSTEINGGAANTGPWIPAE